MEANMDLNKNKGFILRAVPLKASEDRQVAVEQQLPSQRMDVPGHQDDVTSLISLFLLDV